MSDLNRREFVASAAALAAAAKVGQDSPPIRVGVIGCGGRGSGALENCLASSENVEIYALADMFKDRADGARAHLAGLKKGDMPHPGNKVTDERVFTGFDAYKRVLDTGVDMVILATPPGFRPIHFEAAIEAGKHVFTEKPVAVDPVGVRRFIAAGKKAAEKKLAVVAGTQRRHEGSYLATVKHIHDGAIGKITSGRAYWNGSGVWVHPRRPNWTDMEYQLRNWYYFTWLCGDHIVEQHIHNLDVMNWVLKAVPLRAVATGGRQSRTEAQYGHIWDHFTVDFTYPDDVHVLSMCRHWPGPGNVSEAVVGTRGRSNCANQITGEVNWTYREKHRNPYEQEHTDLISSIRRNEPLNEAEAVAHSTLTAIMGREAAYSGQEITWDQMMKSDLSLLPEDLSMDAALPEPPVAVPGKYKFK
jgi:predicted dehydrogenase